MGSEWQKDPPVTPPPVTPPPVTPPPVPNNVFLPPGVDPYYGLTISNLTGGTGSSGGGTTPEPIDTGGVKGGDYTSPGNQTPDWVNHGRPTDRDISVQNYRLYVSQGGTLNYDDWSALYNTDRATTDTGTRSSSGGFQIATPNMTWANSLPTVMPAGGGAAAAQYGPMPFTREANTPGVTYNPPPLTYFNPYNTNPYLPTSNPFALVPNNTGTTQ
jgi:hypothetical protein